MTRAPWPTGGTAEVRAVARMLGLAPKTIRNALYKHRARFDPPRYTRDRGHIRLVRVLTKREVAVLREIFCVRVKRIPRSPVTWPRYVAPPGPERPDAPKTRRIMARER